MKESKLNVNIWVALKINFNDAILYKTCKSTQIKLSSLTLKFWLVSKLSPR